MRTNLQSWGQSQNTKVKQNCLKSLYLRGGDQKHVSVLKRIDKKVKI